MQVPLLDLKRQYASLKTEIDEKITEIAGDIDDLRPKISVGDEPVDKDPKGGFLSLSEFAQHVARADKSAGRNISEKLKDWEAKAASTTSLVEGEDQYGGYLIPEEFKNDLMMAIEQKNEKNTITKL